MGVITCSLVKPKHWAEQIPRPGSCAEENAREFTGLRNDIAFGQRFLKWTVLRLTSVRHLCWLHSHIEQDHSDDSAQSLCGQSAGTRTPTVLPTRSTRIRI